MRFVYIRSLNVLFLFFNKSGSSLYLCFIESWLKWMKIDYETLNLNDVYQNNPTVYMFVRNPLERAVTSFYWTKTFDIKSKENKFPLEQFTKFTNELEEEMDKTEDMHFLPQTWELIRHFKITKHDRSKLSANEFMNYDYRDFFPNVNFKIIQVEAFKQNFQALRGLCTQLMFYPYFKKLDIDIPSSPYYNKTMGLIPELDKLMDPYQKLYTVFLYNFIENSFDENGHHNNLWQKMLSNLRSEPQYVDLIIHIEKIFRRESDFLGYKNSHYINKNKFGV